MSALTNLVEALRCLPGVGPKSAQRMAFYLLQSDRARGLHLANSLQHAMQQIRHCECCNNFTENALCSLCQQSSRNKALLCVVESPIDVVSIEQTGSYNGCYFVLMGRISPLDGVGIQELGVEKLIQYVANTPVEEIIFALSSTVEGQTTQHVLKEMLEAQKSVRVTQLAHGIPMGGELEFLDGNTIGNALRNRAILYA